MRLQIPASDGGILRLNLLQFPDGIRHVGRRKLFNKVRKLFEAFFRPLAEQLTPALQGGKSFAPGRISRDLERRFGNLSG